MFKDSCAHPDIRKFGGVRCCLSCSEAVFESARAKSIQIAETPSSPTFYQYSSLDYKLGQEIRLVDLLPGEFAAPIRCRIIYVNLDDDPNYDAVSYTWATESGDCSRSCTVHCIDGGIFLVTVSCDAAVRQPRRPGSRRYIWIDAICK